MKADALFREGRLQEAVDAQIQEVKANPGDQNRRLFLFELLAFTGDLDRARRQAEALSYDDPELEMAAVSYRKLLEIEEARRQLLSDTLKPQFLTEPPEHVKLRLEAINRMREGRQAEAAELLEKANAAPVRGMLNGKPFESLRDADDLFGTVLEVVGQGTYYWVPLEEIETLQASPPRFPRDLIWYPARISIRSGAAGDVFLPALYPNTHEHADNQVKLGRMTDWKSADGGPVLGMGLRTFLADEDDVPILEFRELKIG